MLEPIGAKTFPNQRFRREKDDQWRICGLQLLYTARPIPEGLTFKYLTGLRVRAEYLMPMALKWAPNLGELLGRHVFRQFRTIGRR